MFENEEVEKAYNDLYKKYEYLHVNWGKNHIITFEDVANVEKIIKEISDKHSIT